MKTKYYVEDYIIKLNVLRFTLSVHNIYNNLIILMAIFFIIYFI